MSSAIRRRIPETKSSSKSSSKSSHKSDSKSDSILDDTSDKPLEHVVVVHKPKTRKRRNTFIFLLGGLCGIVAAGFFAKSNDLINFPGIGELSMDSLFDALPAGLVKDMRDFAVRYGILSLLVSGYAEQLADCWNFRMAKELSLIASMHFP
jgi:phospholipid:diacylglycerol acyltransferase